MGCIYLKKTCQHLLIILQKKYTKGIKSKWSPKNGVENYSCPKKLAL